MATHFTWPVARICGDGGAICGTGFVVGARHVVTCAHVVDDALGRPRGSEDWPSAEVSVDLQFQGRERLRGRVVAWFPMRALADLVRDPLADIAVLEVVSEADLSGGIDPSQVDRRLAVCMQL